MVTSNISSVFYSLENRERLHVVCAIVLYLYPLEKISKEEGWRVVVLERSSFDIIAPWDFVGRQNSVGLLPLIKLVSVHFRLGGKWVLLAPENGGNSQVILAFKVLLRLWEVVMLSTLWVMFTHVNCPSSLLPTLALITLFQRGFFSFLLFTFLIWVIQYLELSPKFDESRISLRLQPLSQIPAPPAKWKSLEFSIIQNGRLCLSPEWSPFNPCAKPPRGISFPVDAHSLPPDWPLTLLCPPQPVLPDVEIGHFVSYAPFPLYSCYETG